jgi:hypothetical protein
MEKFTLILANTQTAPISRELFALFSSFSRLSRGQQEQSRTVAVQLEDEFLRLREPLADEFPFESLLFVLQFR